MKKTKSNVTQVLQNVPENLHNDSPQRCPSGDWTHFTGTEKHRVVDYDTQGWRGRKEMIQISAGNRTELLLQVETLGLRDSGSHWQTLQENQLIMSERKHLNTLQMDEGCKGWISAARQSSSLNLLSPDHLRCDCDTQHSMHLYMFTLTCRNRGRLSLRALSCCVRLWGSNNTSTIRNSNCWAFDVASRGLQCFTKQPKPQTTVILTCYDCLISWQKNPKS